MSSRPSIRSQIIADVRTHIESGQWPAGTKLPSISQLAIQYQCSEGPVKMALAVLHDLGLIEGHQGRGTYVATR